MSSYLVLARKYRPQTFRELVGQEVLVQTLTNAIKSNRLHHSYILTGIRGVGKTTTARIIAKTINCLNKVDDATACNECDNCVAITNSKHPDVIEIDAASKTGVDDMREIIDNIAYAPVSANYKIYIIDEVHMLSNSAFNALLKTLEEPPKNVMFIFATTEIRKVPITIISRCQRFDLRRLNEDEIALHLENILEKENISFEKEAISLIAKMSEGSVRDSLSLLDQAIVNNNSDKITLSLVEKMLGVNDKSLVISLFDNLAKGNFENSLQDFNKFYSTSSDILKLTTDLMEINYLTSCLKVTNSTNLDTYSENQKEKISEIAQNISLNSLTRIWQILQKSYSEINFSTNSKIAFEMLMIRICHLVALPDLKEVITKISAPKVANDPQKSEDLVNEIMRNFEGAKLEQQ